MALLCHLYGIKPYEAKKLTETQLSALLGEANWVLYLRDRAMRDYHFMKVDHKALAEADLTGESDPVTVKARERFLSVYALPEMQTKRTTKRSARDFTRALKKAWVPNWALAVSPPIAELEELAK